MVQARAVRKRTTSPRRNFNQEVGQLRHTMVLEAATALFFEQGYLGASMDAIAYRLSVTKPFLYQHFRSKGALLSEICERGTERMLSIVKKAACSAGTPTVRLQTVVRDFTRDVFENQQFVMIYFREEMHLKKSAANNINKMRKEINRHVRDLLNEGNETGEFRIKDTHLGALAITGMTSYAYAWYRREGPLTSDELAGRIAELVLEMVGVKRC